MNKKVSLVAALALFAMLLVGCAGKFDMDKSIEKLKDKGLTEGMCYITEEEWIKIDPDYCNTDCSYAIIYVEDNEKLFYAKFIRK